ncbi:MAG: DUF4270 family protein [Bacteroidetes bacterium]|nr:MAG: DUF4270 family protein [Bacteroidota bacterium]TAG87666.1 MAG: DUF4270 family protein [Bacteroidota bacterium]
MNTLPYNKNKLFLILFSVLLLFACEKATDIGFNLVDQQSVETIYTELPVEASTIVGKDLPTNTSITLLCGQYNDNAFGKVTSRTFFQVSPAPSGISLTKYDKDLVFDSLSIEFPVYNYYADTTKVQTFRLHRLTETLDESVEYTNKNTLAYDPTPITSLSIKGGRILANGFMRMPIPNSVFKTDVFNLAKNNSSKADFLTTLKGLVLVPDVNDNAAVMGFEASNNPQIAVNFSRLMVYYTAPQTQTGAPDKLNNFVQTFFVNARFNQITSVRNAGTFLDDMNTPLQAKLASASNNRVFVQAGVNYLAKLSFPTLQNLRNQGTIAINRAELVIKIAPNSADVYSTPRNIVLIQSNATNESLTFTNQFGTVVPIYAFPQGSQSPVVSFNSRDLEYRIPLTSYIQSIYSGSNLNKSLIVRPGVTAWEVSRMIILNDNGTNNFPYSTKLRLFYTKYN